MNIVNSMYVFIICDEVTKCVGKGCWNFILRRIVLVLILICELWICYMLLCDVYNLGRSN